MGLQKFKNDASEVTAPAFAAVDAVPYVRPAHLAFAQNDPIAAQIEKEELNGSVKIDNTGRGLLRMRNTAQELNTIYGGGKEEEEALQRLKNGGYTDAEITRLITTAYINLAAADHPIIDPPYNIYAPSAPPLPLGHTAGEYYTANNGQKIRNVYDEKGNFTYRDDGFTCDFDQSALSPLAAKVANQDLIDEQQAYNITYKVDQNGIETKRTYEDSQVQLALTLEENKYTKLPLQMDMIDRISDEVASKAAQNDPSFTSAAPSGITSSVAPTEPFASAAAGTNAPAVQSQSIMFQNRAPAPWEPLAPKPLM